MYILKVIRELFQLLDNVSKKKYLLLQLFFLISAIIQVAGVASIAPFVGVLSNPSVIQTNTILSTLYEYYSFTSNTDFIIAFAAASLMLIVLSNLFSGITLWLLVRFSIHFGNKLQNSLLHNLLSREYIYHKCSNYTDDIALINQEAPRFVYMVLQPFLILTSQSFIIVIILIGLIMINPFIAAITGAIIGGAYLLTYILLKRSLLRHGKIVSERNTGVQAALSEAFIGIKDVLIGNKEETYKKKFEHYNRRGLVSMSLIGLAGDLPRLVIETIAFGAILLLAISLLLSEADTSQIITILSLYGLAGYKLLPSMHQIYKSLTSISANGAVVIKLSNELKHRIEIKPKKAKNLEEHPSSIELCNTSFTYPNSNAQALNSINVEFKKGSINVIAGSSGSGKSTLADILLGLLKPSNGELLINGFTITQSELSHYQHTIGYVPQNIFLTNESVLANVAFGIKPSEIRKDKVMLALKLANADEFTLNLPQGVNTILGQDGKLLSGGQRQRIGIARALYRDETQILVLDEPTSALDIHSEHDFMQSLHDIKDKFLIILISHSPSAIKMSDNIFLIDKGELKSSGNYNDLIANSPDFYNMMSKVDRDTNA